MAQLRIFLSHSSTDRDFADALARALRDWGIANGEVSDSPPSRHECRG
jgi:hypothetical protein